MCGPRVTNINVYQTKSANSEIHPKFASYKIRKLYHLPTFFARERCPGLTHYVEVRRLFHWTKYLSVRTCMSHVGIFVLTEPKNGLKTKTLVMQFRSVNLQPILKFVHALCLRTTPSDISILFVSSLTHLPGRCVNNDMLQETNGN